MLAQTRWQRLMQSLRLPGSPSTYDRLVAAYGEKQRHYHTAEHIADCIERLDEAREYAQCPAEVELALWFHDAIYKPMRTDNEQKSADWAHDFLSPHDGDAARRVRAYILDTRHESSPADGDAALLVDIDLSILGRDTATYDRFEASVRREYRWVPRPLYRRKRREILASFLARGSIYVTAFFRDRYEVPARSNLGRAIAALES